VFFASLVAHELGHSIVAQRRGLEVRDITLWLFGGVATIEGDARTPRDDFAIALAGPLTSFAITVLALASVAVLYAFGCPGIVVGCTAWLSSMNFVLAVFNLAPAAPLDGGRLLRAWLWHRTGDHRAAALRATRAGQVFALVLMALGLLELAVGSRVEGAWMLVLGWVVRNAARAESRQALTESGASLAPDTARSAADHRSRPVPSAVHSRRVPLARTHRRPSRVPGDRRPAGRVRRDAR